MPIVENTQQIEASPQEVWDFISDIRRGPEWVTVMKDLICVSDEQLGKGTVYAERVRVGPITTEAEWHVTTFDPPRVQVHESNEAMMRAILTMRVEPNGTGSRLVHRNDYQVLPVFRPLGWVIEKLFAEWLIRREMNQTVANAKRILETQ